MTARPATADYGRLTVMLQAKFRVTRLFTVPPGAFRPAPKIDSAVARLVPLGDDRPHIASDALYARVVAAAFGQRRKTLRNALAAICSASELRPRTSTRARAGRRWRSPTSCGSRTRSRARADFPFALTAGRTSTSRVLCDSRSSRSPAEDWRPSIRDRGAAPDARCARSSAARSRRARASRRAATRRTRAARKRSSSALALPSTGGAARRILSRACAPSPWTPATSVRFAPGCTCSISSTSSPSSRRHAGSVTAFSATARSRRLRASAPGASAQAGR